MCYEEHTLLFIHGFIKTLVCAYVLMKQLYCDFEEGTVLVIIGITLKYPIFNYCHAIQLDAHSLSVLSLVLQVICFTLMRIGGEISKKKNLCVLLLIIV